MNQGYDHFVVKNDTKVVENMLYTQRKITRFVKNKGGLIDQYDLICTTFELVVTTTPQMWLQ